MISTRFNLRALKRDGENASFLDFLRVYGLLSFSARLCSRLHRACSLSGHRGWQRGADHGFPLFSVLAQFATKQRADWQSGV